MIGESFAVNTDAVLCLKKHRGRWSGGGAGKRGRESGKSGQRPAGLDSRQLPTIAAQATVTSSASTPFPTTCLQEDS